MVWWAVFGSLTTLSGLESAAAGRQEEEAKVRSQSQGRRTQSKKIEQLKTRRDELLKKLQELQENPVPGTRDSGRHNQDTEDRDADLQSAKAYLSELKDKLSVYGLTGVSVVKTDPDNKVLCFTTSHRGVFLESYHLKLQRLASGHFKVVHHDLPPFLVHSTLPDYLQVKDVISAVRPLQEALSMFVMRREELKGVQAKFGDSLHVDASSAALDFLCCRLDIRAGLQVRIVLKYGDLCHFLPTSVDAVPLEAGGRKQTAETPDVVKKNLHTVFCTNRLCVAIPLAADLVTKWLLPQNQQVEDS